jgi:hypothetical protein
VLTAHRRAPKAAEFGKEAIMKAKLNQIIAVEKGTKERVHKEFTGIAQSFAKTEPMQGISRTYQPATEDGEQLPPEHKYVQINVAERLEKAKALLTDLFDVTYTKELGNTRAKGTISVDGRVILADVPVTYLLFLEKQLTDLRNTLSSLPRLDPAERWAWDDQQGYFKSAEIRTARTKKVTEFVIAAPATEKHPAQVKEVTNDVLAGYWSTVKYSATMEPTRIAELVERTETLLKAVKFAREEANGLEIDQAKAADALFGYIFSK